MTWNPGGGLPYSLALRIALGLVNPGLDDTFCLFGRGLDGLLGPVDEVLGLLAVPDALHVAEQRVFAEGHGRPEPHEDRQDRHVDEELEKSHAEKLARPSKGRTLPA